MTSPRSRDPTIAAWGPRCFRPAATWLSAFAAGAIAAFMATLRNPSSVVADEGGAAARRSGGSREPEQAFDLIAADAWLGGRDRRRRGNRRPAIRRGTEARRRFRHLRLVVAGRLLRDRRAARTRALRRGDGELAGVGLGADEPADDATGAAAVNPLGELCWASAFCGLSVGDD